MGSLGIYVGKHGNLPGVYVTHRDLYLDNRIRSGDKILAVNGQDTSTNHCIMYVCVLPLTILRVVTVKFCWKCNIIPSAPSLTVTITITLSHLHTPTPLIGHSLGSHLTPLIGHSQGFTTSQSTLTALICHIQVCTPTGHSQVCTVYQEVVILPTCAYSFMMDPRPSCHSDQCFFFPIMDRKGRLGSEASKHLHRSFTICIMKWYPIIVTPTDEWKEVKRSKKWEKQMWIPATATACTDDVSIGGSKSQPISKGKAVHCTMQVRRTSCGWLSEYDNTWQPWIMALWDLASALNQIAGFRVQRIIVWKNVAHTYPLVKPHLFFVKPHPYLMKPHPLMKSLIPSFVLHNYYSETSRVRLSIIDVSTIISYYYNRWWC